MIYHRYSIVVVIVVVMVPFQLPHDAQVDLSLGLGDSGSDRDRTPGASGSAASVLLLSQPSFVASSTVSSRATSSLLRPPLSGDAPARVERRSGPKNVNNLQETWRDPSEELVAGDHMKAQGATQAPVQPGFSTTAAPPSFHPAGMGNRTTTPAPDLPSFSADPFLSTGNWSINHSGAGVHFRHVGRIVGSLHFGHLRFDAHPKQLVQNFT